MNTETRQQLIETIVRRQHLKDMSRLRRLMHDPVRAFPFYILATVSHIRPYKISFKTLWGTRMTSYLPEGNTFYYYGYCEANLASFLIRFLKPGMIFIDIGAHVGYYSMLASILTARDSSASQSGRVHSFEPTPRTFGLLKENTRGLKNVTINNVALSNTAGTTVFSDYGPGYGAYNTASKEGAFISRTHQDISIPTLTLDEYCGKNKVTPDVIKIDAEGFEYHILRGMKTILSTSYISNADHSVGRPFITLEMANEGTWAENCAKSAQLLKDNSYTAYEMSDDGFLRPHESKATYTYTNILFVPTEKMSLVSYLVK